jgi:predicted flap endonuclease-1-like 5' DNA nuclease
MVNYTLKEIEGIGPANSSRMQSAKVLTVQGLLKKGGTPKGRKELAEQTGLSESVILKWVNMADLFRVNGVGKQYAELLEKSGVDTVKELRNRRADNLVAKMAETNAAGGRRIVRQLPGLKRVQSWIDEAKKLPPAVSY